MKGKFGVIDKSGDFTLPPVYDSWLIFTEGLAYVECGGKYGYIDLSGEWVIPGLMTPVLVSGRIVLRDD